MKLICLYMFRAALLLAAAGFGSLFADNIIELHKRDAWLRQAESEVVELRRQNMALIAESKALESDPFYIELTLRRKLRWIRPGEQKIDLAPHKSNPAANPASEVAGEQESRDGDGGAGPGSVRPRAAQDATVAPDATDASTKLVSGGRLGLARRSH